MCENVMYIQVSHAVAQQYYWLVAIIVVRTFNQLLQVKQEF